MTAADAAHSRRGEPAAPVSSTGQALSHLRVLDLTGAGSQYCGRLMADLGADVVKVEPPGGDAARHLRPFANGEAGVERGIKFLSLNANKRSVALDLDSEADRRRFEALARAADILVDDGSAFQLDELGLGYDALSRANPGLVYVTITPFGLSGPYSDYLSGELIVQAVGGLMYGFGDPDERPAMAPFSPGLQLSAQHAAFAALSAIRHRTDSGRGQHIEVCVQEVLANILAYFGRYASDGQINRRPGGSPTIAPTNTYPTSDGFIYMQPTFPRHVDSLFEWLDNPILEDDLWKDAAFRRQNGDVLNDIISEFSRGFTKMGFAEEAQRRHIPTAPLMTIHDLMQDDHLAYRKFLVDVEHPVVGKYPTPSGAFRMGASPWRLYRPPPLLGQHTEEVLLQWAAESGDGKGVAVTARSGEDATASGERPLPLKNIRVLDFSRVWAGPYMTRYLAELGAEVIKVESNMLPDRQQARGPFASFSFVEINRGKRSVTLNMRSEKAVEAVRAADRVVRRGGGELQARGAGQLGDRLRAAAGVEPGHHLPEHAGHGHRRAALDGAGVRSESAGVHGGDGHLGAAGVSGHHAAQGAAAGLLRRGDGGVRGAVGAGASGSHGAGPDDRACAARGAGGDDGRGVPGTTSSMGTCRRRGATGTRTRRRTTCTRAWDSIRGALSRATRTSSGRGCAWRWRSRTGRRTGSSTRWRVGWRTWRSLTAGWGSGRRR